jgi:hypothetical protein
MSLTTAVAERVTRLAALLLPELVREDCSEEDRHVLVGWLVEETPQFLHQRIFTRNRFRRGGSRVEIGS